MSITYDDVVKRGYLIETRYSLIYFNVNYDKMTPVEERMFIVNPKLYEDVDELITKGHINVTHDDHTYRVINGVSLLDILPNKREFMIPRFTGTAVGGSSEALINYWNNSVLTLLDDRDDKAHLYDELLTLLAKELNLN